ncbi:MAG: S1 RNA-binding domain-containing protein [Elusimicrobia bacterium]|nr:S1 RNA-binding domain-containing protein [Elusimicrobiota bacterium]
MERPNSSPDENPEAAPAEGDGQTMESLLKEQAEFAAKLDRREVVWVKIVQSLPENLLVDIGEKREAVIPASEFAAEERPAAGRRVPAILVSRGRGEKPTVLSSSKARWKLGWEQAVKAFEEKARVRGRVESAIKGGFIVDVGGVRGFLPSSLADVRPVRNPQAMVGTGVRCLIIELNKEKGQIVLSRRAVLEEETNKRRRKLMETLKVGEIRIGRVVRTAEAGVFVDLGGLDALLPTEEISWKDPAGAKAKIERGQKIRARVLRIDKEDGKVTLGMKQLTPHPGDALRKKYPVKSVVRGKVEEILQDGVRIRLNAQDTAFCPVAELQVEGVEPSLEKADRYDRMAPKPAALPPIWPKEGDEVSGIVIGIHQPTFEVEVSIRRYEAIQDRKRVAQYLRGAPPLTLGQLLNPGEE